MAVGDTTISGPYVVSNTTQMEAHIEGIASAMASGAKISYIPSGGNTVYIAITETQG